MRVVDALPVVCDDVWCRSCCGMKMLYRDQNHMNAGVAEIYHRYKEDFSWVMRSNYRKSMTAVSGEK